MTRHLAVLALGFVLGVAAPVAAADLAGTYVLDLEASESVAEVLRLSGAPGFVGKLADRTRVTLDVVVTDEQVTLVYRTRIYRRTEVILPDGETREDRSHHKTREITQRWDDRGGLESRTDMALTDGEQGSLVCTHRLDASGDQLLEEYLLIQADGTETRATRVYGRSE